MKKEKLEQLIQIHQQRKSMILLAEEFEFKGWKTFLQPALERRSAFDHMCRAIAKRLNMFDDDQPVDEDGLDPTDSDYSNKNIDKAIGHVYRAFFDSADWLAVSLRENILETLEGYGNDCISAVMPRYYTHIRGDIHDITLEIAAIRDSKDIGESVSLIEEVAKYRSKIDALLEYNKLIGSKVPALEEFKEKKKQEELGQQEIRDNENRTSHAVTIYCTIAAIIAAIIIFILGCKFGTP